MRNVPETLAEAALDAALANLVHRDHEPLAARALLVSAQRQLASPPQSSSKLDRHEPACLVALSVIHLVWLTLRLW